MRKPRRLSREELAPVVWELPRPQESGVRSRESGLSNQDKINVGALLTPDARPLTPVSWPQFFGNPNPVEIEVGMGKGLFLLTSALARPDTNFLGVEIVRKYQLYAASRYAVRKLSNVKTVCADALVVLRDHVATGSVAAVHVYFPDPWWKTRHRKRRVFSPAFAAEAARVLTLSGVLHIATDVEEYFGVMTGIVRAMPAFRELPVTAGQGYQTNFERKAQLKGTAVWRTAFERTTAEVTIAADPSEAGGQPA